LAGASRKRLRFFDVNGVIVVISLLNRLLAFGKHDREDLFNLFLFQCRGRANTSVLRVLHSHRLCCLALVFVVAGFKLLLVFVDEHLQVEILALLLRAYSLGINLIHLGKFVNLTLSSPLLRICLNNKVRNACAKNFVTYFAHGECIQCTCLRLQATCEQTTVSRRLVAPHVPCEDGYCPTSRPAATLLSLSHLHLSWRTEVTCYPSIDSGCWQRDSPLKMSNLYDS